MIRLLVRGVQIVCDTVDEAIAVADRLALPVPMLTTGEATTPLPVKTRRRPVSHRQVAPGMKAATRAKAGMKSNTSPPPAKRVPTMPPCCTDAVFAALVSTGAPMRTAEIVVVTKLRADKVRAALVDLLKAKRIFRSGHTNALRYHLTTAQSAKAKADDGLEPVWTGTKERAGQAPSLSSVNRA